MMLEQIQQISDQRVVHRYVFHSPGFPPPTNGGQRIHLLQYIIPLGVISEGSSLPSYRNSQMKTCSHGNYSPLRPNQPTSHIPFIVILLPFASALHPAHTPDATAPMELASFRWVHAQSRCKCIALLSSPIVNTLPLKVLPTNVISQSRSEPTRPCGGFPASRHCQHSSQQLHRNVA